MTVHVLSAVALTICVARAASYIVGRIAERRRSIQRVPILLEQARECIKSDARQVRLRAGAKSNQIKRLVAKHKFSLEDFGTTEHELNLLFSRSLQIPKKVGLEYRLAEPQAIDLEESGDPDEQKETTSLADHKSAQLRQPKNTDKKTQQLARVKTKKIRLSSKQPQTDEPSKRHWDLTGVEQNDINDFIERNFDHAVSR
jgi:hypothetical protein